LLTFSRRQTFNPTVLHVGERVEAIKAMLASSLGGAIALVTGIAPEVWSVKLDVNEFELALVNILLNARDAMSNGGTVTISAENCTLARSDTLAGVEGEFVALRIVDTGCGIAPDVLPKVFDPFFTTKQVDKGTGLGLSQVHGFVHQSDGTVAIASELGKGTTVTLYFPRAHEQPSLEADEPRTEPAGGGTVLVVEDNPDVAEVTVAMLRELGYEVELVTDATAALEIIGRKIFDLVVSDIVMPGSMDGAELAREIRRRNPDLPVLLVTGYSQAASSVAGDFSVLRKPFGIAELSRITARIIAEAKQPPTSNLVRLRDVRRPPGLPKSWN
jgi:CheY-like chemotaxis protein